MFIVCVTTTKKKNLTCKEFGLNAYTSSSHAEVWVYDKKIYTMGIHGSQQITFHGLVLNCDTDLNWFKNIIPFYLILYWIRMYNLLKGDI